MQARLRLVHSLLVRESYLSQPRQWLPKLQRSSTQWQSMLLQVSLHSSSSRRPIMLGMTPAANARS
jgi:hypothetical protein